MNHFKNRVCGWRMLIKVDKIITSFLGCTSLGQNISVKIELPPPPAPGNFLTAPKLIITKLQGV